MTESNKRINSDDDVTNYKKLLNLCDLHLNKLALELSCPICLGFFTKPMLLPCDHVLCDSCLTGEKQNELVCPICAKPYVERDKRRISLVENIIKIHRDLHAAFRANAVQPAVSEPGMGLEKRPTSVDVSCDRHQLRKGMNKASTRGQNVKMDLHDGSIDAKFEEFESSEGNSRIQPSRSQLSTAGTESCGAVRKNITSLVKYSPQSPSSADNRSSNNEGNAQEHKKTPEWNLDKKQAGKASYNGSGHEMNGCCSSGTGDGYARGSKRQRKSYSGLPEIMSKKNSASYPESLMTRSPRVEIKSATSCSELPMMSKDPNASQFRCALCQSSRISEVTGSMLHYANGKSVEGDEANLSTVIHVHTKCFEWAPQVYHEGDTVKNLEKEVARGAKLKCSRCGLKGAALGCYVMSCKKSYHFPCAVEIPSCRWDTEDYLVLCPSHRSSRFPSEKSKTKVPRTSTQSSFCRDTPVGSAEKVLCGSALSTEDKFLLVEFANMADLTVSKFWKPDVTHLIVNTDDSGACTRTLKVLMAILKGCWVLKIDWIKACMKSKQLVYEGPFEVCLDNHGTHDGPKTGQLRALANGAKIFRGLYFYFVGDFLPTIANNLKDLIAAAGGSVLEDKESLLTKASNNLEPPMNFKVIIVYNLEIPEGSQLKEGLRILYGRLGEAQELASRVGGGVVGHKWLIESVAGCKLLPFVH